MEKTHVLILPFQAMGHIKPMLKLAELLCHGSVGDLSVSFFITDDAFNRLLGSTDIHNFYENFPKFRFVSISDGMPIKDLTFEKWFRLTREVTKPQFREIVMSLNEGKNPATCIIADGLMSFAIDVGDEVGIPVLTFRTYSASCLWLNFNLDNMIQEGVIPFQDEDMEKPISCIPGFENVFRRRDLPKLCRCQNTDDAVLQIYIKETKALTRASALILNTIEQLESPAISKLASLFPNIYTIGPLHSLSASFIKDRTILASTNGIMWKEDRSWEKWLNSHSFRSVIYVSFGSIVKFTRDQMLEFWYGLVNSGSPFLWVIRPDSILKNDADDDDDSTSDELKKGTEERGCMVSWVPQEDVLAHPATGGFLTHGGWNSTLESMEGGVGMICWPSFADQQVNSRCVSDLWRNGLDIKDTCDRSTVENVVRELMSGKRDDIRRSTDEIARMGSDCVKVGGSSYCHLQRLIKDIRFMTK